jgi:hypothetical protein
VLKPILATEGAPLVHVPPVIVLPKVVVKPIHTTAVPVIGAGVAVAETVLVDVLVKPLPSVIVTVYIVVPATVGVAITEAPVVAERP